MGKGLQHGNQSIHDSTGLTIIVAQQDGKAADPFDQRRYISLTKLLAKLDQITLPVAKLLTPGDHIRTVKNA